MSIKKLQTLKAKKAFTLVELIVVIAIIAILAAILIPLLVNHVRSSRCSGILSEAKSAANAGQAFIGEEIAKGRIAGISDEKRSPGPLGKDELAHDIDTLGLTVIWGFGDGASDDTEGDIWVLAVHTDTGHGFHTVHGDIACDWGRCPAVGRGNDSDIPS
jgi:prepilin-type N-terminal cleavage/methylation domain-containing protein